jgi:glutamate-1-semialdehyde 2,1-aminomutase
MKSASEHILVAGSSDRSHRSSVKPTEYLAHRAKGIVAAEIELYTARTQRSMAANARAKQTIPLGVPSSFQAYDPHPVVAARADVSTLWDLDGNEYLDLNMGFGALFVGHNNPKIVAAIQKQLADGALYVTPCESNTQVAEALRDRFGLPQWRFTNSGTEATMDAIRCARAFTGRSKIVKLEGGYHGHHDSVMLSMKPALSQAGPADAPNVVRSTEGLTDGVVADVMVIPFNDAEALERALANNDVAAFILEPVMENIGICLPLPGYLNDVRRITREHGTLLIFDEVKTGITAGFGGATKHFGVTPDLLCLAKSVGGGLPFGAFGGTTEIMNLIAELRVVHQGTYNGNPLSMASALATLTEVCTAPTIEATVARNRRMLADAQRVIETHDLPAHTVEMGAKGCITWSTTPVRNYRDYKSTDFDIAFAQWIYGINRGVLLPPGLDEQWLLSVLHTDADVAHHTEVFSEFAQALTGVRKLVPVAA